MMLRLTLLLIALVLLSLAVSAQPPAGSPAKGKAKAAEIRPPDDATRKKIEGAIQMLRTRRNEPTLSKVPDEVWVEVEVYAKAAEWVLRHNEFYGDTAKQALDLLDEGLRRAYTLAAGNAPWRFQPGMMVVRAYRSKIDGSVQPYAVTLPADYGKNTGTSWRLDVVLHGRDVTLTEVKFLRQHHDKRAPQDQPYVQINIFGRTNNAYRWAGETDVFEAVEAFRWAEAYAGRGNLLDPRRVVLRGFSMGGAGAWHLGLHHPGEWAVTGPGAGFTTTKGYTRLPDPLPPYVEKCLHIYDAVDYAENAAMVPVVAYAGANDPQQQAGRNIEARLKPLGIPMTFLIAPDTVHRLTPEYAKKAEAEYAKYAGPGKGRDETPERVRFVTYTTKYSGCDWVDIAGLDRQYEKASVDASLSSRGFAVKTQNVRRLRLMIPVRRMDWEQHSVVIDGQTLSVPGKSIPMIELVRAEGGWTGRPVPSQATDKSKTQPAIEKHYDLQGPIDDAFTDAFLCVRGMGTPWHEATGRYAAGALDRFGMEWDKYLRGTLPIKDDTAVTEDDIRGKNLILFGDPSSNRLIAQVLPKLPLTWTKETVTLAGASGSAAEHVPVLIYPNPLNPHKYVVLNSGHTFHADAFQGTNALLYPRLGDYALLRLVPDAKDPLATATVTAGLFDEFWRVPRK
jgi:dienelactone hydrolase